MKVKDYETGETLDGAASEGLIDASRDARPTGAVCAYRDADGVWQHVPSSQADHYRRNLSEDVITVYVEK